MARATTLSEAAGLGDKCNFQVCSLWLGLAWLGLAWLGLLCHILSSSCLVLSYLVLCILSYLVLSCLVLSCQCWLRYVTLRYVTNAVVLFVALVGPLFAGIGQVADALNTPFEAGSFDLVWSMESGEHMPHKPKYV